MGRYFFMTHALLPGHIYTYNLMYMSNIDCFRSKQQAPVAAQCCLTIWMWVASSDGCLDCGRRDLRWQRKNGRAN